MVGVATTIELLLRYRSIESDSMENSSSVRRLLLYTSASKLVSSEDPSSEAINKENRKIIGLDEKGAIQ